MTTWQRLLLLSQQAMGEFIIVYHRHIYIIIIAADAFGLAPASGLPSLHIYTSRPCREIRAHAAVHAHSARQHRAGSPASWPVSRALACVSKGAGLRGGEAGVPSGPGLGS